MSDVQDAGEVVERRRPPDLGDVCKPGLIWTREFEAGHEVQVGPEPTPKASRDGRAATQPALLHSPLHQPQHTPAVHPPPPRPRTLLTRQ